MILKPADILLWRVAPGAAWLPRLIGWAQDKLLHHPENAPDYYHVGMIAQDGISYYESIPPRVTKTDIDWPLPDYVEVYRLIIPPTQDQLKKMFSYAESLQGKLYNVIGIISFGHIQIGDFPYCSQYVWRICTQADILLCPWDELEGPDEIAASLKLMKVADAGSTTIAA